MDMEKQHSYNSRISTALHSLSPPGYVAHTTFTGYRGGDLNAYLAYTTTCGGQLMDKTDKSSTNSLTSPIVQFLGVFFLRAVL